MRIFLVAADKVSSSSGRSASRVNFGARGIRLSLALEGWWIAVEIRAVRLRIRMTHHPNAPGRRLEQWLDGFSNDVNRLDPCRSDKVGVERGERSILSQCQFQISCVIDREMMGTGQTQNFICFRC